MIFKRGIKTYWYKFQWNGKMIRESTRQGNDKVARQMEAAHRTSLAKGEVGSGKRKSRSRWQTFSPTVFRRGQRRRKTHPGFGIDRASNHFFDTTFPD